MIIIDDGVFFSHHDRRSFGKGVFCGYRLSSEIERTLKHCEDFGELRDLPRIASLLAEWSRTGASE
jgi:hypothetical protein